MTFDRYMRLIVFFDLPVITSNDKRNYRKFRMFLIKQGFIMMQESVYSKLVLNNISAKAIEEKINKNAVSDGLIQILTVTEKQFANMRFIAGTYSSEYVTSTERTIIL